MRHGMVGLALSVGAAQGLCHIGVLKALEEEGIGISHIAGASMGSLVGASYARDKDVRKLEFFFSQYDWKKVLATLDPDPSLLSKGLVRGERLKEELEPLIGDVRFNELKVPLKIVAVDFKTGEEVVLDQGSVLDAVRASISIPAIFVPVRSGERLLIDGGSRNPLPVDVVRKMGAERVFASNVLSARGGVGAGRCGHPAIPGLGSRRPFSVMFAAIKRKLDAFFGPKDDLPNVFDAVLQADTITKAMIAEQQARAADLVIRPDTTDLDMFDFTCSGKAVELGYIAAKRALSA